MQSDYVTGRRFGLDWLRIGAFGLLIFYHIGMYFVSWDWHVKTSETVPAAELSMLATNPWRLTLLFLISGVASRLLLEKLSGPGGFASQRSARLLLPLVAGIILFVAPQPWVELKTKADYDSSFWTFWLNDYFEFGASRGLILPTYNHLWFVAYLWAYSMVLALLSVAPEAVRAAAQRQFDRLFAGWRMYALPLGWLFAARTLLYPHFEQTHALVDDVYSHAIYAFAFFLGVGLARSQSAWEAIVAYWKPAAVAAFAGYLAYAAIYVTYPDDAPDSVVAAARLAHSLLAWGAIFALLAVAQLYLHRDGPVRRYLTDAIFPFYIAHQTIIVLVGYWLAGMGLSQGTEFLLIFASTVAGCILFYECGRRTGWLRPLIGLKPVAVKKSQIPAGAGV